MSSKPESGFSGTGSVSIIVLLIIVITVTTMTTISAATSLGTQSASSGSTATASCLPPRITSISTISASAINSGTVTIEGSCFGSDPTTITLSDGSVVTQPNSTTPSILITDQTQGWGAGFGGDIIGINIVSWTPSTIQIHGLGKQVGATAGAQEFSISAGDVIVIDLSGPNCNATGWPTIGVPPSTPWPSICTASFTNTVGA